MAKPIADEAEILSRSTEAAVAAAKLAGLATERELRAFLAGFTAGIRHGVKMAMDVEELVRE